MIAESEANRLSSWIDEAAQSGGKVLCGGKREGAMLEATLLEDVPTSAQICTEEAFGPVAILQRFSNWSEAIEMVNDSKFGLQAGYLPEIFTRFSRLGTNSTLEALWSVTSLHIVWTTCRMEVSKTQGLAEKVFGLPWKICPKYVIWSFEHFLSSAIEVIFLTNNDKRRRYFRRIVRT
jgi:hypothetical protein